MITKRGFNLHGSHFCEEKKKLIYSLIARALDTGIAAVVQAQASTSHNRQKSPSEKSPFHPTIGKLNVVMVADGDAESLDPPDPPVVHR